MSSFRWMASLARKIQPAVQLQRWVGPAATLLIMLIGGWAIAHLLVGFARPLPAPQQAWVGEPVTVAEQLAMRQLFGGSPALESSLAGPVLADLRLLGILTSSQTDGARAIVRQDGGNKTWVLTVGQTLEAGTRVTRIEAGQVTLSRLGQESRLVLPPPAPIASLTTKH